MLGNDAFDREEIIKAHREVTLRRMADYGGTILAVQDTTGVNYNTHLKTEGIGYISDKTMGVNVHSCLAVSAGGLVLGVLDQSGYNRPEAKDETVGHGSKKVRPIEEKESFRRRGLKSEETLERSTRRYYMRRRKIERVHYVLKSGGAIEKPREHREDNNAYPDVWTLPHWVYTIKRLALS
jgi:hypothetical protein